MGRRHSHAVASADTFLAGGTPVNPARNASVRLVTHVATAPRVPADRIVVTESGILAPGDVARMRAHEVHAFLVGEAFMRAADPGAALAALFR